MENVIQKQYDLIYSYFKTTTEYFDYLCWDGATLQVLLKDEVIEQYSIEELKELIEDL